MLSAAVLLSPAAAEATFPGQNGKIAFSGSDGTTASCIEAMNPDGTGRGPILPCDDVREMSPEWSPDGTQIAYEGHYGEIDIVDADGSNLRTFVYDSGVGTTGHGWSPDGKKLVVSWLNDFGTFQSGIDLQPLKPGPHCASGGFTVLRSTTQSLSSPDWSPDCAQIGFTRSSQLSLIHPDGTSETPVTQGTGASWSPDGQKIAFGDGSQIFVVNADGTGRTQLTFASGSNGQPAWSPAGDRIAFVSTRDGNFEIYTMNANGSGQTNVTNDPGFQSGPDWQPIPINAYPRPKGATPIYASLVPAYPPCTAPNRTHGPPLAFDSCGSTTSPQSLPANSPHISVGSPDHNNAPANSVSFMKISVKVGTPSTPADEADVNLQVRVTDVRCIHTSPVPTCGAINTADGPDYTGELEGKLDLRVTDKDNTPHPGGPGAGTVQDFAFSLTVPCAETGGSENFIGGTCAITTSADGLVPGMVKEGKRSMWELGQVRVLDGGADGDADTAADNNLFMKQGIFVP